MIPAWESDVKRTPERQRPVTERQSPYLHSCHEQDGQTLPLGQVVITLNDPDFRQGYEEGCSTYEQWHRDDLAIDAALLLFLVRNGWGGIRYSAMWQTGYIVGWLFSLFAHANELGREERV